MMWGDGWGMGSWWLILPVMILLTVLLVLMIVIAVRMFSGAGGASVHGPHTRTSARGILDERFARGELTADEYRERLRVLGEG